MTNGELQSLNVRLDGMGNSLKEVLELLKGDKFGQPGLVTRFNMTSKKMQLMEEKNIQMGDSLRDKLVEQEKKYQTEITALKAAYDREIVRLNLKVVKIYWTTGAVSSTIALVISILVLAAKTMGD